MLTLAFESSAKAASAALCRDGTFVAQSLQVSGLTHSSTLLPMAEDMLKNTGLTIRDVDRFAVAVGPGSFTGIRIGVAAVKGLAWGADKPCIGVSTLEAMAWNAAALEGACVCCAMDARRSQVYNALFRIKDGVPSRLVPDRAISLPELCQEQESAQEPLFVIGDGAELCYNALNEAGIPCRLSPEPMRLQSAWGVCMAAMDKPPFQAGELLPVYLRLSQAERERQARL